MTDGGIGENQCSQILGLGILLMLMDAPVMDCNNASNIQIQIPASSVSEKAREEAGRTHGIGGVAPVNASAKRCERVTKPSKTREPG